MRNSFQFKPHFHRQRILFVLFITVVTLPLFSQELPWYGKLRLGVATGLSTPPSMDLAPLLGLNDSSFTMRSGWNINAFIDYNVWNNLNVGFHYRYINFFSPDQFAEDFQIHGFTINSGWEFPIGAGTLEPTIDIGISYNTINDVRNDIFSIAEGEGDNISFATLFLGTGLRATGNLSKYLNIYGEFDISFNIMQDMALPLFSFNVGISFNSSTLFSKNQTPIKVEEVGTPIVIENPEPIQLFPEGELMVAQLYFDRDRTQIIPTNKESVKKAIEFHLQNLSAADYTVRLEGYAVPVDGGITWQELISKRMQTTSDFLIELGINPEKIETKPGKVKPLRSTPKKHWPYLRRVDIFININNTTEDKNHPETSSE